MSTKQDNISENSTNNIVQIPTNNIGQVPPTNNMDQVPPTNNIVQVPTIDDIKNAIKKRNVANGNVSHLRLFDQKIESVPK